MINIIQTLLQDEEYILKEYGGKIIFFKGNSRTYPEEYIEIERIGIIGKFIVFEVHRDVKYVKLETGKKEEACIYSVVIYKKLFDSVVERSGIRMIQKYLNAGEEEKALVCSIDHCDDAFYSIDYEECKKISLLRSEDRVDVKFGGEYLVQNVSLNRGYVVFYNYCKKLQYISSFCIEILSKLKININYEEIFKLYILGHI